MKKKSVKMVASVAVLVVLCGAYFGVKSYVAKQEEQEEQQEETVTNVFSTEEGDIKSLKFLIDKKEVTFEKEGDSWVKTDEKQFPVSQEKIQEAVSALTSIDADRVLENTEDLSEYGLDEPQNTITVTTNDDKQTSIRIGIENESTSQYYVNKDDDRNTVYVVAESSVTPFMNSLYDYAEKEEFPKIADATKVSKIQVESDDTKYTLEKEADTGFWYMGIGTEEEQADTSKVSELTSSLSSSMSYDSFVDYNCTNMSDYGLSKPYATITVDYEEEAPVSEDEDSQESSGDTSDETSEEDFKQSSDGTESADESESEQSSSESAEAQEDEAEPEMVQKQLVISVGDRADSVDGDARYVSVNGSNQIYTISEENLATFLDKSDSDFWSMEVSYVSANQLNSMDVKYGDSTYTINVSRETSEDEEGEETETTTYQINGSELDSTSFSTFFNKLVNMTGQKRLTEAYKADAAPELEAAFHVENGEDITVQYYTYDTNFYAAVVGEKVYLVNKMSVKEMFTAFENLLEAGGQGKTDVSNTENESKTADDTDESDTDKEIAPETETTNTTDTNETADE